MKPGALGCRPFKSASFTILDLRSAEPTSSMIGFFWLLSWGLSAGPTASGAGDLSGSSWGGICDPKVGQRIWGAIITCLALGCIISIFDSSPSGGHHLKVYPVSNLGRLRELGVDFGLVPGQFLRQAIRFRRDPDIFRCLRRIGQ